MSGTKREQGAEACGVGLCTEELTNYSDAPGRYDEPEGTSPDELLPLSLPLWGRQRPVFGDSVDKNDGR